MRPVISVIVPIYNVENYVDKCIQSIVGQTWRELEIILVDDGSTDASGAVIRQANSGTASGARNAGIDASSGQWLTFVDGDDYLDPDMVEYLYGLCERTGSQMSRCGVRHVGFPAENDQPHGDGEYTVYDGRQAAEYTLLGTKGFSASSAHALFSTAVVRRMRFCPARCFEDLEYAVLAAYASASVCCSLAPKYNYVYRSGNSAASGLRTKIADLDAVTARLTDFVGDNAPELRGALTRRYVDNALHILEYAALHGAADGERQLLPAFREKVLAAGLDDRQLGKTSRLLYRSLRLGMGPFAVTCRAIYTGKRGRSKLREHRKQK